MYISFSLLKILLFNLTYRSTENLFYTSAGRKHVEEITERQVHDNYKYVVLVIAMSSVLDKAQVRESPL